MRKLPRLAVTEPAGHRSVPIHALPFAIGRRSEAQLQIHRTDVSKAHAEIVLEGGVYLIRDVGSRFGTFVNPAVSLLWPQVRYRGHGLVPCWEGGP